MKKAFSIVGMIVGMMLILFGIITLCGGFGDADYYGGNSPYDSGYASFGADYYTYSVNNTAETTVSVNAVNSNLRQISDLLRNCLGLIMIALGFMSICGFGIVCAGAKDLNKCENTLPQTTEFAEEYIVNEENEENEETVIEEVIEEVESDN